MLHLQFDPFPILRTTRLELRALDDQDVPFLFSLRSNDKVNRFLDRPKATDIQQVYTFLQNIQKNISDNAAIMWGISYKGTDQLVGTICFWNINKEERSLELGYEMHPDHQGKGIMQEVLSTVLQYGIDTINAQKIYAYTHILNERSEKVLQKSNFKRDLDAERSHDNDQVAIWHLTT